MVYNGVSRRRYPEEGQIDKPEILLEFAGVVHGGVVVRLRWMRPGRTSVPLIWSVRTTASSLVQLHFPATKSLVLLHLGGSGGSDQWCIFLPFDIRYSPLDVLRSTFSESSEVEFKNRED